MSTSLACCLNRAICTTPAFHCQPQPHCQLSSRTTLPACHKNRPIAQKAAAACCCLQCLTDCSARDNASVPSTSSDYQMLWDHCLDGTLCTLQHPRAQLPARILCWCTQTKAIAFHIIQCVACFQTTMPNRSHVRRPLQAELPCGDLNPRHIPQHPETPWTSPWRSRLYLHHSLPAPQSGTQLPDSWLALPLLPCIRHPPIRSINTVTLCSQV